MEAATATGRPNGLKAIEALTVARPIRTHMSTRTAATHPTKAAAGRVIVLANQKGGVGKTTLSCHIADRLWTAGVAAVLVDADPQAASTAWMRRVDPEAADNGRLVGAFDADALHAALARIRAAGQIAVVDGPPGVEATSRVMAYHADLLLVPCGPSLLDLWATGKFLEVVGRTLEVVGENRPGAGRVRVVANRRRTGLRLTRQSGKALEQLAAEAAAKRPGFDVGVLAAAVGLREPLASACVAGTTVLRQANSQEKKDKAARRAAEPAAREVRDLVDAALRELTARAVARAA